METEKKKSSFWDEFSKLFEAIKLLPKIITLIRPQISLILISYGVGLFDTGLTMIKPRFAGNIVDIVTRSKGVEDLRELAINMVIFCIFSNIMSRISQKA